jgi:hypothetical protein
MEIEMATELALTKPDPTMDEQTLRVLMAAADRYVKSGLLPAEVNTPQKALVIMTAGRELGVPATYALRNIHVVKGKPVCSAELMLALVRRAYGPGAMRVGKTTNTACTVQYREQGWDGISEYTFTIEDAKQAGVAGGSSWRNYPAAMLRARCISAVVRFAFPECIAGLYTPEEMGAEIVVTDEGLVNVVDSTARPLAALSDEHPNLTAQMEAERKAEVIQACDAALWNRRWHATVKGTRYATDDARHEFMRWYTDGATESLSGWLSASTDEEALTLIATVEEQIRVDAEQAERQPEPAF